jgi:hypothetical protein
LHRKYKGDVQTNQPTKKLTKGGILCKCKTSSIPKKRIAGTGNGRLKNRGCANANGFVFLTEGLDSFGLGPIATGGQFVLYEKNFVWIDVWE